MGLPWSRMTVLKQGKTKVVLQEPGGAHVFIRGMGDADAATASTTITCNCFRLLEAHNVPTHFIERVDERTFRARRAMMYPIKMVARRLSDAIAVEFFFKDDILHDPLMRWNEHLQRFDLYAADKPIALGHLGELPNDTFRELDLPMDARLCEALTALSQSVFPIIEGAWAELGVTLEDLKIECGLDLNTGKPIVADIIDNDSWHIHLHGYDIRHVAELTNAFLAP